MVDNGLPGFDGEHGPLDRTGCFHAGALRHRKKRGEFPPRWHVVLGADHQPDPAVAQAGQVRGGGARAGHVRRRNGQDVARHPYPWIDHHEGGARGTQRFQGGGFVTIDYTAPGQRPPSLGT